MTRATGRDGLHDVLRRVGDLSREEVAERVFAGVDAGVLLRRARARTARRAHARRRRGALHRRRRGRALPRRARRRAARRPARRVPRRRARRAVASSSRATRARTGRSPASELRARYGVDAGAVLRELERAGELVRGEMQARRRWSANGATWRSCGACGAPRSPRCARRSSPPSSGGSPRSCPPGRASTATRGAGAGIERLREVLVPLQGIALPVQTWERDVLPRRTGAYSQSWLDSLCASGEVVWVGAGALGRSGRVALYFREDAAAIGPPAAGRGGRGAGTAAGAGAQAPGAREHELLRARLAQGPCFFTDLLAELDAPAEALREALWDLVWAGEVTNDAWAPLRAPRLALAQSPRTGEHARVSGGSRVSVGRSRFAARRARTRSAADQVQGRWSLTEPVFQGPLAGPAGAPERRRALAELLLERYGIVTREQVLAEGIKGGFAMLYDTFAMLEVLGVCRRGYFIEGMGGAQFALPGAVERLRAVPAAPSSAGPDAEAGGADGTRALVLAAADPAQPYGAALPWPRRAPRGTLQAGPSLRQDRQAGERGQPGGARPARVAGAYVVLVARRARAVRGARRARSGDAVRRPRRRGGDARRARGARARRPRGARGQARARAHRRRGRRRLAARRRARRAGVPPRPAAPHAHRLSTPNPLYPSGFDRSAESLCLSDGCAYRKHH